MNRRHIFGQVFGLESVIAGVVFLLILGIVFFSVARRRARPGIDPSHRANRPKLEKCYVVVLAAIAASLVAYTAWQNHREQRAAQQSPVRVNVTAFQWCWKFSYPQASKPVSTTSNCRGGKLPTLVVPTGRTIQVTVTSRDVIHSLWVPALRYKMDAFPDHKNTFTITMDREGRWIGRCAEFCGERHAEMHFWFKAVSPEKYSKWLAAQSGAQTAGAAA
ncbi:cytochrome c oxidase subunit II [Streptomyces sp. NPDC051320]|uniref:cytochrome c oxidase subunit II n=1 Tax=Streptomyces sp. NPDC051320 TaxID=3154644 RepID=UPI0034439980